MKKIICILLSVSLIFCLCSCSNSSLLPGDKKPKAYAKIDTDLNVEINSDNYNSQIYLTKDKFIFVSKDNSSSFGSSSTPYLYDLKTKKISRLFDFDSGDFSILMATESKLYICLYTYTEYKVSEWGFCLVEYDVESGKTKKIYETPNTVSSITSAVIGDTLVYCASTSDQDALYADNNRAFEVHAIKDGKDSVIKSDINSEYAYIYSKYGKSYLELSEISGESELFEIKEDLSFEKSKKKISFDEENESPEQEKAGEYFVDGKFGDWYIVDDGENKGEEFDNGYDYSLNYYLYNVKTMQTTKLTKAYFTLYYA